MGKRQVNNKLYIVQARPETVHGKDKKQIRGLNSKKGYSYHTGNRIGIATGKARILNSPRRK
jgi:pyruvate,water dikinase